MLKVVKPKPGETKDEFISRCVPIEINAGKPRFQALAICFDKWDAKMHHDEEE